MAAPGIGTAPLRDHSQHIFRAAVEAVDPETAVHRHVVRTNGLLKIGALKLQIEDYERIFVVGAGKASAPMAKAIEDLIPDRITAGAIVVKDGHGLDLANISVFEARHPVPDQRGVAGSEAVLRMVAGAGKQDLVLCLISGGGSALMIAPADGISLSDKQDATRRLLACGATIHEINTVRKHLSRIKGGLLARRAQPATVVSLILSDVVGDDLDVIASGPAVPDSSTFPAALEILHRYDIWNEVAPSIRARFSKGTEGLIADTPKPGDPVFENCHHELVGTNMHALRAASTAATELGYNPLILTSKLEGEAREIAKVLVAIAKEILNTGQPSAAPACVLVGGETTVTLQGDGKGGRCQEFALSAAIALNKLPGMLLLAGGTDGNDGPTDAAGAVVDGETMEKAAGMGIDIRDYLKRNDAYRFFRQLDDLLLTGPTRTNVGDVYLLLVGESKYGTDSANPSNLNR